MDAAAIAAAIDAANATTANAAVAAANANAAAAANPVVDPATAAAIANAITAALANMQPPHAQVIQLQAPVVPPAQAAVFSRTPALTGNAILDYQTPGDAKIFKENTSKLDTPFLLATPNVTTLITELASVRRLPPGPNS
jgi:hypothetical protein